jgi:hypothetical protein
MSQWAEISSRTHQHRMTAGLGNRFGFPFDGSPHNGKIKNFVGGLELGNNSGARSSDSELEAMAENSAIEWTDATWNPVTGCTKISAGCDNCYAAPFSERFRGVAGHPFATGFDLTLRPERLGQPLEWVRHHGEGRLAYQVLTKRSSLMQKFVNQRYRDREAPQHIWFGVSVENAQAVSRIAHLQKARREFASHPSNLS